MITLVGAVAFGGAYVLTDVSRRRVVAALDDHAAVA
jgi:hypothetical protein